MSELNKLRALLAECSMQLMDAAKLLKESAFVITAAECDEVAKRAKEAATGKVAGDSDLQDTYEAQRALRRSSVLGRYGHLASPLPSVKPNGEG